MTQSLKFKVDISTFRLLGRELITDRITALFELVKNCYDANATKVTVSFENINPITEKSKIVINDDGIGMSFEDIRDKWMVIGTDNKRASRLSAPPFNRKLVGKKGIGRFAVDKLGSNLLLKTTTATSEEKQCVEIDWSYYAEQESIQLANANKERKLFTDIENKHWKEKKQPHESGTTLEISAINDTWTENDISRASKELSKLISPTTKLKYPFDIFINAPEYENFNNYQIQSKAIDISTLKIELNYDFKKNKQEILAIEDNKIIKKYTEKQACGPVRLVLYYFNQTAKNNFRKTFTDESIDGIKIYRDGLIATPFVEYNENRHEQKDLFGLDKRRWSGFFDKISTRDLLGWIEISDELNPGIIDATNRQDFVDNSAWRELKNFVIEQVSKIEAYLKQTKTKDIDDRLVDFQNTDQNLRNLREELLLVKKCSLPRDISEKISQVEIGLKEAQKTVRKSFRDFEELKKEKKRQENLFYSLVSLQTFSAMMSHITRTSLGKIKRAAEFINKWIPDIRFNDKYKKFSGEIVTEMNKLGSAIDFLLKYAKDDEYFEEINVKNTIEHIFNDIYKSIFVEKEVKTITDANCDLSINYNLKSFEDIFDNLISNSLKAFEKTNRNRIIKCSSFVNEKQLTIIYSDNGCGIPESNKNRIFDVFFTTTAEQGGAGLGLYIVKSRIEALHGTIELIENELRPTGATFRISLPFKR